MTPEEFFDAVENDTAPYTIRFRPQYFCPIFKLKAKLRGAQYSNLNPNLEVNGKTMLLRSIMVGKFQQL